MLSLRFQKHISCTFWINIYIYMFYFFKLNNQILQTHGMLPLFACEYLDLLVTHLSSILKFYSSIDPMCQDVYWKLLPGVCFWIGCNWLLLVLQMKQAFVVLVHKPGISGEYMLCTWFYSIGTVREDDTYKGGNSHYTTCT